MILRFITIINQFLDINTVEQKRHEKPGYFVYQSNLSDEIFIANQTQFWWNIMKTILFYQQKSVAWGHKLSIKCIHKSVIKVFVAYLEISYMSENYCFVSRNIWKIF